MGGGSRMPYPYVLLVLPFPSPCEERTGCAIGDVAEGYKASLFYINPGRHPARPIDVVELKVPCTIS